VAVPLHDCTERSAPDQLTAGNARRTLQSASQRVDRWIGRGAMTRWTGSARTLRDAGRAISASSRSTRRGPSSLNAIGNAPPGSAAETIDLAALKTVTAITAGGISGGYTERPAAVARQRMAGFCQINGVRPEPIKSKPNVGDRYESILRKKGFSP
jgi:hypothetical protein